MTNQKPVFNDYWQSQEPPASDPSQPRARARPRSEVTSQPRQRRVRGHTGPRSSIFSDLSICDEKSIIRSRRTLFLSVFLTCQTLLFSKHYFPWKVETESQCQSTSLIKYCDNFASEILCLIIKLFIIYICMCFWQNIKFSTLYNCFRLALAGAQGVWEFLELLRTKRILVTLGRISTWYYRSPRLIETAQACHKSVSVSM